MTTKIMTALNKFESALRTAIRKDMVAEQKEIWEASSLKACEAAWAEAKAARIDLEAAIEEHGVHNP